MINALFVEKWLISKISGVTGMPIDEIDRTKPLREMGIYAKTMEHILLELGELLGRKLPATLAFDFPTVETIVTYLFQEDNEDGTDQENIVDFEPIAIVGIGCRFPGGCNSPEAFWKALIEGEDLISIVPEDRWNVDELYDANPSVPGKMTTKFGGFIEDIGMFDAAHFGITPREAQSMDVQQRLALEVTWEALEAAGELGPSLSGSNTGVFMGAGGSDYTRRYFEDIENIDFYCATGSYTSIVSNRISYVLGLQGPSISMDTGCSSSLVSIHLACRSLVARECNLAVAGGVNSIVSPEITVALSKAKMMAPDGKCKTFDASANGYVRSEGCGVVILKRLEDAVRDNNNIICVIKGSSVNHVGRSNGISAPSGTSQKRLIKQALKSARVKASEIQYIEAHGTGTLVGDPIEVEALGTVMGEGRTAANPLIIGSVKTNIGHTELAAGAAGLIKVALAMKNEAIPRHLHFSELNPRISLNSIPAIIPTETISWKKGCRQRRLAGISSFGFGGVNAHIILEDYEDNRLPQTRGDKTAVFMISAKNASALSNIEDNLIEYFDTCESDYNDNCYTANVGRARMANRLAIIASNNNQAKHILVQHRQGVEQNRLFRAVRKPIEDKKIAFLFTGQGSQYSKMGKYLYEEEAVFRNALNRCDEILRQYIDCSIIELIYNDNNEELLSQTQYTQPILFSFEYALALLWKSWGVIPTVVAGHSVGEYAAACISGVFTLPDALKLVAMRGRLIYSLPKDGSMLAVSMPLKRIKNLLDNYEDNFVSIAAINSPQNIVLSGKTANISLISKDIEKVGGTYKPLLVSHAFHSSLLEPIVEAYREVLGTVSFAEPDIPIISNVTGDYLSVEEICSSDYWCRHILESVQFMESIQTIYDSGITFYLEVGPHPVLNSFVKLILRDKSIVCLTSQKRDDNNYCIHESIAGLFVNGWDFDLPIYNGSIVPLPTYPFQKKKYWYPGTKKQSIRVQDFSPEKPLMIDNPFDKGVYEFRCPYSSAFLQDHKIKGQAVFPAAVMITMVLACVSKQCEPASFWLEDMHIEKPLIVQDGETAVIQFYLSDENGKICYEMYSRVIAGTDNENTSATWEKHLKGYAVQGIYSREEISEDIWDFDLQEWQKDGIIGGEEFYNSLRKDGLEYGQLFRVIQRIDPTAQGIYAFMECNKAGAEYMVHPGILDACSQLLLLEEKVKEGTYVFAGFDRLFVKQGSTERMYCRSELNYVSDDGRDVTGMFRLVDKNGSLSIAAEGIHLVKIDLGRELSLAKQVEDNLIIKYTWNPVEFIEKEDFEQQKWLLFIDQRGIGEAAAQLIRTKGHECTLVFPGKTYREKGSSYYIRPGYAEDLENMINSLSQQAKKIDTIVNIWPIDMGEIDESKSLDLDNHQYSYGTGLYLIQALLKAGWNSCKIWSVTECANDVNSNKVKINFEQASIWGFGKVVAAETPDLFGGIIDIDGKTAVEQLCGILLKQYPGTPFYAIRDNQVYCEKLITSAFKNDFAGELNFREDSCYVITGGTGGLGRILTSWLIEQGAKKIAVISRSASKANFSQINLPSGTDVELYSCDITDEQELRTVFKKIDSQLAPVKGIFHLAGVLRDGPVYKQTWENYLAVYAPKICGAWNLHKIFAGQTLDYFVLFSSVASMIGTAGQSNYAAANAVSDAFAQWRSQSGYPTVAVSWGLWRAKGMAEQMGEQVRTRLLSRGIGLVESEQALQALRKFILERVTHVGYASYNSRQFVRMVDERLKSYYGGDSGIVGSEDQKWVKNQSEVASHVVDCGSVTDIISKIQKYVGEMIWITEFERIDIDENLLDLGLDSLVILNLRNILKKEFGSDIPYKGFLECRTIRNLANLVVKSSDNLSNSKTVASSHNYDKHMTEQQPVLAETSYNTQQDIVAIIQKHVGTAAWIEDYQQIDIDENLLDLGLDSLVILNLRNSLKKEFAIDIPFKEFLNCRTIRKLADYISNTRYNQEIAVVVDRELTESGVNTESDDFPLTEVQHAYWIGRKNQLVLGNVSCHLYLEVNVGNIDIAMLNAALNQLIARHGMLRASVLPEGRQKINPHAHAHQIGFKDCRQMDEFTLKQCLLASRDELSHIVHNSETGPLFAIRAFQLTECITQLHISLDMLIADGYSFNILLRDLYAYYSGGEKELPELSYTFRDYVMQDTQRQQTAEYQKALEYWNEKIGRMPAAPQLPLAVSPEKIQNPVFIRNKAKIAEEKWRKIKKIAANSGLTPSGILLAVFAYTLRKWCNRNSFSIMMTLFNRQPFHPQVNDIVGDFTSLIVLSIDIDGSASFLENAQNIQNEFWDNMENSSVSGLEVLRMKAKKEGKNSEVIPVVFTSVIPYSSPSGNSGSTIELPAGVDADIVYSISQTPQVWLDFQIFESNGMLTYNWDTVQGLFDQTVLSDMFSAYHNLLLELAENTNKWEAAEPIGLPERQILKHQKLNQTAHPVSDKLIHELFLQKVAKNPDGLALIQEERTISYKQLASLAIGVKEQLLQMGINRGDIISVLLPKGPEQVVAVLGVLISGAVYLPLDVAFPKSRVKGIIRASGSKCVICDSNNVSLIPDDVKMLLIESCSEGKSSDHSPVQQSSDELAYVIYTSGSTGTPKGVMISHQGAVNTILDINERFGVRTGDKILALSQLNFDLSVYDIFGMLAGGGTVIFPTEETLKDPIEWNRLIKEHSISLWNTVPALMEMLVVYLHGKGEKLPSSLRLVLMSGDWIPLGLAKDLLIDLPHAEIISLGGATEASIWSILYPIKYVADSWHSIPYGLPMRNQKFYVLNENMEDCPDMVAGELYIGGSGVALGYLNDVEKSATSFIIHPRTGERLYRTGDYGRYLTDGLIEFLGRKDQQVKIHGHRIELGEIESVLCRHPEVMNAVAVIPKGAGEKQIVGYIIPEKKNLPQVETEVTSALISSLTDIVNSQISDFPMALIEDCNAEMNAFALRIMMNILRKYGFYQTPGESQQIMNIMQQAGIDPRYEQLIQLWLQTLTQKGILVQNKRQEYLLNSDILPEKITVNDSFIELKEKIKQLSENIPAILSGEKEPFEIFYGNDESNDTPETLVTQLPGTRLIYDVTIRCVQELVSKVDKPRILEIGARTGVFASEILHHLQEASVSVEYTAADSSLYFLDQARLTLNGYNQVTYELIDLDSSLNPQKDLSMQYDLIILANSLHRCSDLRHALMQIHCFLKKDGLMVLMENTENTSLQLITAAVAGEGFSRLTDQRNNKNGALLSAEDWNKLLQKTCYLPFSLISDQSIESRLGATSIVAKSILVQPDETELIQFAKKHLPDYMIPKRVFALGDFPLTPNGKIDRNLLQSNGVDKKSENRSVVPPKTHSEIELVNIWGELLKCSPISILDNFFELGGDSLLGITMISKIRNSLGVEILLRDIFNQPTVAQLAEYIDGSVHSAAPKLPIIHPDQANRYQPFSLTEVQQAYWLGRSGAFELGSVSTHSYFEIERKGLEIRRLEEAWNRLIIRHDMMRVVINGQKQVVREEVEEYKILIIDLRDEDPLTARNKLMEIRETMSHQVLSLDEWPPFQIRIVIYGDDLVRLMVSFDNLIFDGSSMLFLFDEWARLYDNPGIEMKPLNLLFRDYVIANKSLEDSQQYKIDREYWLKRVETLPGAPELPILKRSKNNMSNRFERLDTVISREHWASLKAQAKSLSITPAALLLTTFSTVLGKWSKSRHFTINLTLFNRLEMHPEVFEIIGDFTSLTLLEVDIRTDNTFQYQVQQVQDQLWSDLSHATFGGVSVIREYARINGVIPGSAVMPVVFTSALGLGANVQDGSGITRMGELIYNITQTPQVWLDHQVYENNGCLVLNWDYVRDLFPEGLMDTIFGTYCGLLEKLAVSPGMWNSKIQIPLPIEQKKIRMSLEESNPVPTMMLHELVSKQVMLTPDNIAVYSDRKSLTYRQLYDHVSALANELVLEGAEPNTLIAIVMNRGWQQVVGVLAILFSGAAYLPIDPNLPEARMDYILSNGDVQIVLTQPELAGKESFGKGIRVMSVQERDVDHPELVFESRQRIDDLAYVIYTSGSTGEPKGVMINHKSVVNTLLDINHKFAVKQTDRTIAISNLTFDLSIYDIFGPLIAGGAVVMLDPDKEKEPSHWLDLLAKYNVTIWNSVPALMQVLTERAKMLPQSLRVIMLSGDWIPLGLADAIRKLCSPEIQIISLGGATEASIWSIYFPITSVKEEWSSVPYGYPLINQTIRILNDQLEDVPDHVIGQICIGGTGLAQGYWKDKEKTQKSFFVDSQTGERFYRTGDLGKYLADGVVEILGREDGQIKIRGYRVELGEISAVINAYPGVVQSVVMALGEGEKRSLAAFIVRDKETVIDSTQIVEMLSSKLPKYMIPAHIRFIDQMPLTANGKIDRKKLARIEMKAEPILGLPEGDLTDSQQELAELLREILAIPDIGIADDFFNLGANSLHIMSLQNKIERKFGIEVDITTLLAHTTIQKLDKYLTSILHEEFVY